jgi:hypothetical protein
MITALRSHILDIPDLPLDMYLKNLPNDVAQAFGHLDRTRKGQRSTRAPLHSPSSTVSPTSADTLDDTLVVHDQPLIYVKDFSLARMHVDATGQFPVKSVRGYAYDLLFYVEEYNNIHVECCEIAQHPAIRQHIEKLLNFLSCITSLFEWFD